MLCSLKTKRPDKRLENRLIFLSYTLILLTASVIAFFMYPQYSLYCIGIIFFLSAFSLLSTIKTLKAGEEAISYGGFANELLKDEHEARRIDNADYEAVIENTAAQEFLHGENVLTFLEKHLSENRQNKGNYARLNGAIENLCSVEVELSLNLKEDKHKFFSPEEWYRIRLQPMYLKKTDIFKGAYSIKKIKKETYYYWQIKNITAEKNIEQIMQEERHLMHDFMDYLPAGLYICDKDYKIEYCNHAFSHTVKQTREEVIGKNLRDYIGENSELPLHPNNWQGEIYIITGEEGQRSYIAQENFRENGTIKTRGIVITDIPTEQELQQRLEEQNGILGSLFKDTPLSIIICDKEGKINDCNQAAEEFINKEKNKIINKAFESYIKAEDQEKFQQSMASIINGTETSIKQDIRLQRSNDEERAALMYISPLRTHPGTRQGQGSEGCVIYMIDATARKNLELQFAQAQKMQAMGQLAGGVAHDFNNLLTAMIGFCDLLLQRHGIGDPSFADIIQIKNNANRAAGLVRQLLAFSRKQPLKPKLIEVTENFAELSHMLKRILGEKIKLNFQHGNELGYIRVDPVQFTQVIMNLAVNAKDAMNGKGTLTIRTRTETLLEPYQFGADTIKPGEFVVIEVSDTGCGIPIENLTRIFEPFFSTKQNVVGSGTGLGLAMVYGIVRQTEGFIKVDSIIGQGTTFGIYLPRFEKEEEVENSPEEKIKDTLTNKEGTTVLSVNEKISSPIAMNQKLIFGMNVSAIDRDKGNGSGGEDIRILFVEDEDSVRAFAVRALKKKGYEVIACNSAENALEHLNTDKDFDLMITDMVMPGMNGAELAGRVKEAIPNIKIILASGYSEEIARRELAGSEEFAFIAKPFSLGDLTKKVFEVLSKSD